MRRSFTKMLPFIAFAQIYNPSYMAASLAANGYENRYGKIRRVSGIPIPEFIPNQRQRRRNKRRVNN